MLINLAGQAPGPGKLAAAARKEKPEKESDRIPGTLGQKPNLI
jgi:hypothetical protein